MPTLIGPHVTARKLTAADLIPAAEVLSTIASDIYLTGQDALDQWGRMLKGCVTKNERAQADYGGAMYPFRARVNYDDAQVFVLNGTDTVVGFSYSRVQGDVCSLIAQGIHRDYQDRGYFEEAQNVFYQFCFGENGLQVAEFDAPDSISGRWIDTDKSPAMILLDDTKQGAAYGAERLCRWALTADNWRTWAKENPQYQFPYRWIP